jgi:tetratricopeptide (TPR) repeat protein
MPLKSKPRNLRTKRAFMAVAVVLIILTFALWYWQRVKTSAVATYVGEESCSPCHADKVQAWRSSHHARSMQMASDSTVLGNFSGTQFTDQGVTSTFFKKDGKFYLRTDGKPQDHEIPYTFGFDPLQQYLVPFPNGRMQSFGVAWDSLAKEHGGQRWFQLYPGQKITPADPMHWTGRNMTWNDRCADCHSTNLQKNYDLAKDSYDTKWSNISVSCEACHGPGSKHVEWAQTHKQASSQGSGGSDGLTVDLRPEEGSWLTLDPFELGSTTHWQGPPRSQRQNNTCAPCHSRRRAIASDYQPGQPFLDAFSPSLLEEGAYYSDGQARDDDYQMGSFVQSTMYEQGVTCSDCHDPHSGKVSQGSSNAVCSKCHSPAKFASENHHHHNEQGAGALCVNCHMPPRNYLVVGVGHDHSFRVPRPDLSVAFGTPNACNQCHKDKPDTWAAETFVKWYGYTRTRSRDFAAAIDAGRRGLVNAESALTELIVDSSKPAIARATALSLLPRYLSPYSFPALPPALLDNDPLVRKEAVRALSVLTPQDRAILGTPLLTDPIRLVRIEAGRVLAGTPLKLLHGQEPALDRAIAEFVASEMASAERPDSHMDLALLYEQMGRPSDAESELKTALRLDPKLVPAMVSLADLYRTQNRDAEGQQWLEKAIAIEPNAAEPIHALALLKIRQKQYGDVMSLLAKATALEPDNLGYSYMYAVALNSSGHPDQAIAILQQAHEKHPADRQMLIGLVAFEREKANFPSAINYARQLVELSPNDPSAKAMSTELQVANDPGTYQYWLIQGDADYKQGRLPDAKTAYGKGMELALAEMARAPQRGYTRASVAYFAARLQDKTRAEEEISRALQLAPGEDEVVRRAVLTYEALGERDRAFAALKRGTPQLLYDMNRQPDLPDFRDDPRFHQLLTPTPKEPK